MEKEILNLQEVCELLSVSEKTMLKLLKEENVPARKIGREWRFSRAAIIQWIAKGGSAEYIMQEEDIQNYERETSRLLELLDRIHDRVSVIKKSIL